MKTTSVRMALVACVLTLATGAVVIAGALASEKEGPDSTACAVKAAADGSQPVALSEAELRSKLEAAGYIQVRSLGHEEGCVEAKGLDKNGKRFEVYLHPTTGEIVSQR